jgi:prolipoprotein diacylglyceryl transferase
VHLGFIPPPPFSVFEIGPLSIYVYGILIGIGVVAAVTITVNRYERFGGDPKLAERASLWAIFLGFAGARAAYVSTHLDRFQDEWWKVIAIWEGGIALFGGLTAGAITAFVYLRRHGGDFAAYADAAAVGIPVAQAIGRWGNYFNQELFGTPTTLSWALEVETPFRPARYAEFETFHPTFLYESTWNLLIVVPLVLWVERRGWLPRGGLFFVYLAAYGFMRFMLELIRTDTTFRLLGLSRNGWVAAFVTIGSGIGLVVLSRRKATAGLA